MNPLFLLASSNRVYSSLNILMSIETPVSTSVITEIRLGSMGRGVFGPRDPPSGVDDGLALPLLDFHISSWISLETDI
jgi:hypothetical protein